MGDEGLRFELGAIPDGAPVPLAHRQALTLGSLLIEPALRRISNIEGRSIKIEPLVMQVLLTLVAARGATLSRDDLIAACWDSRIVSDDAINRVMSRLRKIFSDLAGQTVSLETVAKVGYRLAVADGANAVPLQRKAPTPGKGRRGAAVAAASVALAASVVAWTYYRADAAPEPVTIGIEPADGVAGDRGSQKLAGDLTSDLARLASANSQVEVIDRGQRDAADVDFIMRVAVERDGNNFSATARLVATDDGIVLWSRSFSTADGSVGRLREQVAMNATALIRCGLERSTKSLGDARVLRLYFSACDALEEEDWSKAESYARQVVELRPGAASGWACLAMTSLLAGSADGNKRAANADQRRRAGFYARKALALDPTVGRAYLVLAALGDADPKALTLIEQGIRADPEMPGLRRVYSASLHNLGYRDAAVAEALRAAALDPSSRSSYEMAARRLITAGRTDEAFAMLDRAERIWPGNRSLRHHRVRFLPYLRDPRAALQRYAIAKEAVAMEGLPPALTEEILLRRVDPSSLDPAALDRKAEAMFAEHPASAWYLVWAMEVLGERERALRWLARAPGRDGDMQWSLLFSADVAGLRRDPRFFAAMRGLGLVDSWRERGKWPDFCAEPGLRYDCRTDAMRTLRTTST